MKKQIEDGLKLYQDKSGDTDWKFMQILGDKTWLDNDQDIITSIQYDKSGNFFAAGDKSGRIIIFQLKSLG